MEFYSFRREVTGPLLKVQVVTEHRRRSIVVSNATTGERLTWDKKNPYRERCALYEDLIASLLKGG